MRSDTSPTFDGLASISGDAWVKSGLSGSLNLLMQVQLHMDNVSESVVEAS